MHFRGLLEVGSRAVVLMIGVDVCSQHINLISAFPPPPPLVAVWSLVFFSFGCLDVSREIYC